MLFIPCKLATAFMRLAVPLLGAALLALALTGAAHAAPPLQTPGAEGGGGIPGQPLVDVIYAVAQAFIQILIFSSVAIFAASIARGTWSAQLANLVGSPMGMSQAWLNIIAAIFTFILAVLSPMLVNMVFDIVQGFVVTGATIPTLGGG